MWSAKTFQDVVEYANAGRNPEDRPWVKAGKTSRLQKRGDNYALKLYDTDVVTFCPNGLILNSGGYRTVTTKARINEVLRELVSPVTLFQEKGVWYLSDRNWEVKTPFVENISISWDGKIKVDSGKANAEVARIQKLTKQINHYATAIADKLIAGELEDIGPGDCMLCWVERDCQVNDKPFIDSAHLETHLDESYYMALVICNAFMFTGRSDFLLSLIATYIKDSRLAINRNYRWDDSVRYHVTNAVRAYLKTRLGIAR